MEDIGRLQRASFYILFGSYVKKKILPIFDYRMDGRTPVGSVGSESPDLPKLDPLGALKPSGGAVPACPDRVQQGERLFGGPFQGKML